jgi:hypothetical protein
VASRGECRSQPHPTHSHRPHRNHPLPELTPPRQSIPLTSLASATASTLIPPLQLGLNVESPLDPSQATGRWYGTRLSTIILVKDDGHVTFVERDVAKLEDGQVRTGGGERRFGFRAEAPVR